MFEICEATGGYRKTVIVRDVNLNVAEGEIVALLGRNGVGKTTLLKYAMGLTANFGGRVILGGVTLAAGPAKRAKAGLGYVPQGRFVFPRLTVVENIAAAAVACGQSHRDAVKKILSEFPALHEKAHALAGTLSGGQQQLVALGRALATQPKLLILDEPTEGVQPSIIDELAGTLLRLNREEGLSILVAEQDLDFCLSISERAYIMDRGTVVKEATKDVLSADNLLLQNLLAV